MQKEFLGIGRTWATIWLIIVCLSVALILGKITFDQWWLPVTALTASGGVKSGLEKIGNGKSRFSEPGQPH